MSAVSEHRRRRSDRLTLTPHAGDFGTASWALCACCSHNQTDAGWMVIRAGEPHYIDLATRRHVHLDCADVLVRCGHAVIDGADSTKKAS